MSLFGRLFGKKTEAMARPATPAPQKEASPPSPVQRSQAPACSLCGRPLQAVASGQRYDVVIGGTLPALYAGVVCTVCRATICLDCQKPAHQPCKKCGGDVLPATPDVIPSATRTYLYFFRVGQPPSKQLMQTVLNWWRKQHGPDFDVLGGRQVDHVPEEIDYYIGTFMHAICDQYEFSNDASKVGYGTVTVDDETLGVARFIDQTPPRTHARG